MKRIISVFLICVMMLLGITPVYADTYNDNNSINEEDVSSMDFSGLKDPDLLHYVEDTVYSELVQDLDSSEYFVENVSAVYVSKEFIEELDYNSKENVFFGYSISELENLFQGQKYVFTLGEDNTTTVVPFEDYDDTYEKVLKNVAIGSGVILLCVTVTVLTGGTAPAISLIFAASAKSATVFALSSGIFSFVSSAVVTGLETHDIDAALKTGLLKGSEGFKWGAITGGISGGAGEAIALHGATLNGLTMNEAAIIQKESGFPLDMIKEFHSMEEYQVFRDANLKPMMVGGKSALVKTDIDLTKLDSKGRTNLERMRQGLAPQDSNGISYELHHVGQRKDGTLAILSDTEHKMPSIHGFLERTEAHGPDTNWDAERQAFWKAYAALFG